MRIYSFILIALMLTFNMAKRVDNNVDNSRHLIKLSPSTVHKSLSKRDTNNQNSIVTDIDKSSSTFNTYIRDIPLLYESLSNADNQVLVFSIPDYDIHKLDYKVWQYPRLIDQDMTPLEKETVIRENIVDFINDYVVNLKSDGNIQRGNDLNKVLMWLENDSLEIPLNFINENGKNIQISKKPKRNGESQLILNNGHQVMTVDLIYNQYSNGIIFVIKGCFDKKLWT